jgi:hypothetical protein
MVINFAKVTRVVRDDKAKNTTIYFDNGSKAVFKKHGDAVWAQAKRNSTVSVAVPSSSSSRW